MHEIKRFTFENRTLTFERIDGEWWANMAEAAEVLGYGTSDEVQRLYSRHRKEFLESETITVNLTANPEKPRRAGNRSNVRLFSARGLEHLATLGRTPICVRFRRWLLDVVEQLRDDARIVTHEQLAKFAAAIRAESSGQIAVLLDIVKQQTIQNNALAGAVGVQASSAGKLLSYLARTPEVRKAIEDARDAANGQNRFEFNADVEERADA